MKIKSKIKKEIENLTEEEQLAFIAGANWAFDRAIELEVRK